MKSLIELKNITKEFDGNVILRGIDLEIKQNEFVTFLGPSGCGKTTALRIIGGLLEPNSGDILFEGKSMLGIPAYKRPTNTVFQRYALFPHLDVYDNLAFGLRVRSKEQGFMRKKLSLKKEYKELLNEKKTPLERKQLKKEFEKKLRLIKDPNLEKKEKINKLTIQIKKLDPKSSDYKETKKQYKEKIKEIKKTFITRKTKEKAIEKKVLKFLKMVDLEGYEYRKITELSGGQQQRVAIARALINEPQVLLLDEPLAALDLKLRKDMQYELKELQQNAGITFIYVTHDQEEALTMSDKVVVMNKGEIQQIGTPEEIYNEPINRFVASFIGESNIISGVMLDDYLVEFGGQKFKCIDRGFGKNEKVDVVIRPEDLDILPPGKGLFDGVVDSIVFKGVHYEIDIVTKENTYTVHTTDYHKEGSSVSIKFNPDDIHIMEIW